jgi:hypothetical protein
MKDSMKNPKPLAPVSAKKTSVDFRNASAEPSANTKMVGKKHSKSQNPALEAKPSRTHVKATSGARYGVRVKFQKSEAPEAGAIQANGRILNPAIKRQSNSFGEGMKDHN